MMFEQFMNWLQVHGVQSTIDVLLVAGFFIVLFELFESSDTYTNFLYHYKKHERESGVTLPPLWCYSLWVALPFTAIAPVMFFVFYVYILVSGKTLISVAKDDAGTQIRNHLYNLRYPILGRLVNLVALLTLACMSPLFVLRRIALPTNTHAILENALWDC